MEFLMESNHPSIIDAAGTIRFIRVINKLFDLHNSKNFHARGYKKPLNITDKAIWMYTIEKSIFYKSIERY